MKTILMAGGRGTRIRSIAADIPKPMISVCGKPVLEHEIECLRNQGFTDIIITVGHLAQCIMDYFGDGHKVSPATGQPFGVNIRYFIEKQPLGNAGAVFQLWKSGELDEDFMLLIADALFNVDFNRFVKYHKSRHALATVFTHPNSHPFDSGLVAADEETHIVTGWLNKEDVRPEFYKNRVNAGLHILSPDILSLSHGHLLSPEIVRRVDLDRDILKPFIGTHRIYAYDSPEYCRDMGTPERYDTVLEDMRNGFAEARNLCHKQRAIFVQIDDIISRPAGFLKSYLDFELRHGASEAVRMMNGSGFLCIVIVNLLIFVQGKIKKEQLNEICNKMETLLGKEGAYIDGLYYDQKTKQDSLICAAKNYNISLEDSWMAESSYRDIESGRAAECREVLFSDIKNKAGGGNITVFTAKDLLSAVKIILKAE